MNEYGPNPPSRKEEDFPKTTTIPEGWIAESLPLPGAAASLETAPAEGENTRPAPVASDESLFKRGLDPFPKPNTIPTGWDLSAME
jgi:hypothetical protein